MPEVNEEKKEKQKYFCTKCKKLMTEDHFYSYRDGTKTELCKPCFTMHIDNFKPETYVWALEKFDVPYVPAEWNKIRDAAYAKNPLKVNGMSVLGKYLSKMKLTQWRNYRYADSEKLSAEAEEKAREKDAEIEAEKEKIQKGFEEGKISEAEYKTYMDSMDMQKSGYLETMMLRDVITGRVIENGGSLAGPEDSFGISEEDLPDLGAQLTKEDKIYLAMKWGREYSPEDWIALEQNYTDMCNSFDIQDQDTKNTLILLCKIYLKQNQMLDSGDYDGALKLSRMYDSMRKSAKFTAAQNKDKEGDFVDCVGQLIAYCEKEGGRIPRFNTDLNYDIIDKVIKDMKQYNADLFKTDPAITRQIEDYIKNREIAEERRQKKTDVDKEQLEEQDYYDYSNQQEELRDGEEDELTESSEFI